VWGTAAYLLEPLHNLLWKPILVGADLLEVFHQSREDVLELFA
jgi:hypothetical protein